MNGINQQAIINGKMHSIETVRLPSIQFYFNSAEMKIGDAFESYSAFILSLRKYEKEIYANFYISNSTKFKRSGPDAHLCDKIKFAYLYYRCKIYGFAKKIGAVRKTFTYKDGCNARLSVKYDTTHKVLRLVSLVEVHNHDLNEGYFNSLPRQRRFTVAEKEKIESVLGMKPIMRNVQQEINKQRAAPAIL